MADVKRTEKTNTALFPIIIFFIYFVNLLIYPQWHLPGTEAGTKIFLAVLYAVISAGAYFYARRFARRENLSAQKEPEPSRDNDRRFLILFSILALSTHLPYLNLPLTTLGDAHMHAGLPALSWAGAASFFHDAAGFNLRYITISAAILFLPGLFKLRNILTRENYSLRVMWFFLVSGLAYCVLVIYFSPFEKFGGLEHFFRYPLLGKLVYFTGYSIFGIHEWVGRLSQVIFLFAGALYFKKLLALISSPASARCAYAGFLMFPPFWNYGHHNYLEAGVIFFCAAVAYYLLLYLKTSAKTPLLLFVTSLTLAVIYKEYLLGLLPISAALIAGYNFLEEKLNKEKLASLGAGFVFPSVIALQYLFSFKHLRSLYEYYPQPVEIKDLLSYERLLTSASNIPTVIGIALTVLSAAGLAVGIKKFKTGTVYMILWFLVFWVLISASTGYAHPRTNLIFYIPLCAFICFLAGGVKKLSRYMPGAVFLLFSFISLFVGPGETVSTGETVSLNKIGKNIYPYDELFEYIKREEIFTRKVYAPMVCEPSHFYIAKHGIDDAGFLDRRGWAERAGSFREFLLEGGYGYIVTPEGAHTDGIMEQLISKKLRGELLDGKIENVSLEAFFCAFGKNFLYLFKFEF